MPTCFHGTWNLEPCDFIAVTSNYATEVFEDMKYAVISFIF